MRIFNKIIKRDCKNLAMAIGCFDGVHKGHQEVINQAVKYRNLGLVPSVFTFSKIPKYVISHKEEHRILSQEEKHILLAKLGIEEVYNVDFNYVRSYLAEDFVRDILADTLGVKFVICGFNFRFGLGCSAGVEELVKLCSKYNIKTNIVPPIKHKGMAISSTRIRKALEIGDDTEANSMIGRVVSPS